MVRSILLAALAASTTALNVARREAQELYTIELAPGVTQQVTEAEKYALKAVSNHTILRYVEMLLIQNRRARTSLT